MTSIDVPDPKCAVEAATMKFMKDMKLQP